MTELLYNIYIGHKCHIIFIGVLIMAAAEGRWGINNQGLLSISYKTSYRKISRLGREIWAQRFPISLTFNRRLGSSAAEAAGKCQRDHFKNTISRLKVFTRPYNILSCTKTVLLSRPGSLYQKNPKTLEIFSQFLVKTWSQKGVFSGCDIVLKFGMQCSIR